MDKLKLILKPNGYISRCVWAGTACSVDDFVTEVTDYGLCHTINSGRDGRPLLQTSNTGNLPAYTSQKIECMLRDKSNFDMGSSA